MTALLEQDKSDGASPVPSSQVLRALQPSLGGDAGASLDEVIARLGRAKVGASCCRHLPPWGNSNWYF